MEVEGVDALLADAYALVARHSPWTRSFQADGSDILAHDKIIRWGLSDRLLDIAENYLCVPVGYDGINVFFTKADGMEAGARRWHRDAEDRRMLKIALYLNDVDEDGGPLQVLRRRLPNHDRMVGGKFPILRQGQLEKALGDFDPNRDVVTCTGKAGTVVFADTAALYHRGKPASARDRCAIFFNYMTRAPLRPFRCERSTISRAQIRRLAASMPKRQRDCLLWCDSSPSSRGSSACAGLVLGSQRKRRSAPICVVARSSVPRRRFRRNCDNACDIQNRALGCSYRRRAGVFDPGGRLVPCDLGLILRRPGKFGSLGLSY